MGGRWVIDEDGKGRGSIFLLPMMMMMMMMDDDADDAMIRVDDGDRCAIPVAVAAVEGKDAESWSFQTDPQPRSTSN